MYSLKEGEILTPINNDLTLIQKDRSQPFSTDAYLLYAYMKKMKTKSAIELGSGSGVISLLSVTGGKFARVTSLEIQSEMADINRRNIEYNSLSDRADVIECDIRKVDSLSLPETDVVFTNPPYMKGGSGMTGPHASRGISRHELNGGIDDFCKAASRLLKFGGLFYAVYRPERVADILFAMKNNSIEPKEMTFVCADSESAPSLMLVKGKKGASSGCFVTKNLFMYSDKEHKCESDDIKYIYENGDFNECYRKQ